jgi:hypothetical protein
VKLNLISDKNNSILWHTEKKGSVEKRPRKGSRRSANVRRRDNSKQKEKNQMKNGPCRI